MPSHCTLQYLCFIGDALQTSAAESCKEEVFHLEVVCVFPYINPQQRGQALDAESREADISYGECRTFNWC